ncbi:MAG TPA: PAS domain-containing protein [Pyrinomonadaceae bacterium]|nr:PAS domain-containing protein [Pyrinomonadaceae bacterium]
MKTFPQHNFATGTATGVALQARQKAKPDTPDQEGTAERRLSLLLEVAHIIPWEADFASSRFTHVGQQAEEVLGYDIADWFTPNFWSLHLHPDDRERTIREAAKLARESQRYELEYRMIAKDGRVVWLQSLVSVTYVNDEPAIIRGFSIDVSRSRRAEAALRDLSGRLINAQEEERSRVARELHDDLSQRMALLSIELEQFADAVSTSAKMRRRFESLQNQAQEISSDIHRLSYRLHPSKLDHLGLASAIKSLCEQIDASGKLRVYLHQQSFTEPLPKDITLCLFRIAQETLRNAVKHSQAKHVRVMVQMSGGVVRLTVTDDGCGFDMRSPTFAEGLGFVGMRERLRIVGGELEINSQRAQGTRIEVTIPLGYEPHAMKTTDQ